MEKWYNKKDECYMGAHFLPFEGGQIGKCQTLNKS